MSDTLKEICEGAYAAIVEMIDEHDEAGYTEDSERIEEAYNAIIEDPLEVTYRGFYDKENGWTVDEVIVLLGTGGPASRIVVSYDGVGLKNPRLEVQDWGTPWTDNYELKVWDDKGYLDTYLDILGVGYSILEER